MAETNLPSTPADGNIKTVLVPAVADLKAPKLAECNASTALDISCYLTKGGWNFGLEQATISDERECDTTVRNEPGVKTPSLQITGIDNTNTAYAATANKLVETLTEKSEWVAIRRRGKPHTVPFASGDKVEAVRFRVGVRTSVAAETNSVIKSTWNCFASGAEPDAAIAA